MKKVWIMILAAAMVLSLWACGKDDIQPEDPAPTTCEHSYADAT